ncbi:Nucleoporin 88, partial [Bulinus truncatus]
LQYQLFSTSTDPLDLGSSLPSQSSEPFSWKVKQILQKRDLNPILKSCSTTEQSQKNCYQLLIHATKVLGQEYIPRLDRARQEIDARIAVLFEHKQYHLEDLKVLARTRQELTDHASEIAEKLEATKENHERLFKRVETILRRLQSNVPVLSEAERQMMKELRRIRENMEMYEQSFKQVKCKLEMQAKQSGLSSKISSPFLHQGHLSQIHGVLKEEGNEIEELRKEVSRLDLALS